MTQINRLLSSFLNKIKDFFKQYFKKIFCYISNDKISYIFLLLILVASGYALTAFVNQIYRAIASFMVLLLSLVLYTLKVDFGLIHYIKRKKRLPFVYPGIILLFIILFSVILTVIYNSDYKNVLGYLIHCLLLISSYLVVLTLDFATFKKTFVNIIFFFSLIALYFYFLTKISGINFGLSYFNNSYGNIYSNYYFIYFQNIYLDRLQSIFWEPGLYSSFLLLSLFFEISENKKPNVYKLAVFIICVLLTKSTFAYLVLLLIVILFVNKIVKNDTGKFIFFLVIFLIAMLGSIFFDRIIAILSQFLPDVFGKILESNVSMTTRLLSPVVNLSIFSESVFFGVGFANSYKMYPLKIIELGYSGLLDAQTSTSTFLMSVFGVFGGLYSIILFVFPLFYKKYDFPTRVILSLLFIIILNKEPHYGILITYVFMFYFFHEIVDAKVKSSNDYKLIKENRTIGSFLFEKGNNQKLVSNVVFSVILKGATLLIGFFSVRVFSAYFNNETTFGVWLTILSIIGWVMTFDLGLGNGLKNKLIESLAAGDKQKSKEYISSTYFATAIVSLIILILGLILIFILDLNGIFNVSSNQISPASLKIVVAITLLGIITEFNFKNIIYVFHAMQKQYYGGIIPLISSLILLIFASFARFANVEEKLYAIAIVFSLTYSLVYIFPTLFVFLGKHKDIAPGLKHITKLGIKNVLGLGLLFFLIQLSLLFFNSTDTIFITNIYGPEQVVSYTYYSKLFTIISSIFVIVGTTAWASIRNAYVHKDINWIKKIYKWMFILSVVFSLLTSLTIVFFQIFINLWLDTFSFPVDYFIVAIFIIHTSITFFVSTLSAVSNGIQTLKSQFIAYAIGAFIKVILTYSISFLFPHFSWILVIMVHIISYTPFFVLVPIGIRKKLLINEEK